MANTRLMAMLQTACGPRLWELLETDTITEVMVNPDGTVWVEEHGHGMYRTELKMPADKARSVISIVASSDDAIANDDNPSIAAVLPESGARFQGFLPPAVPAPMFVIRQRAKHVYPLESYVENGYMQRGHAYAIYDAVLRRENILIVGGTGSGKTTLANAILRVISQTGDRVLTIEDTPELQCTAENYISFFVEPDAGFTWQKAVQDALRSRPDRIVVGEVRDSAALDLLKAWNTGHNGGCATIHANSALRGLTKLESYIQEIVAVAPVKLIAEAVDLVVHITGTVDGREVREVARVLEHDGHDYVIDPVDAPRYFEERNPPSSSNG
jgi:type IV secretion system protein VirB11